MIPIFILIVVDILVLIFRPVARIIRVLVALETNRGLEAGGMLARNGTSSDII